jgi:hypothetical protein
LQPLPPRRSPSPLQPEPHRPSLLCHLMPPPNDEHYEEEEILLRQIIIRCYRVYLNSPPETSYKTEEMFEGWYDGDGVVTYIMGQFGLVGERDRKRFKRVLVNAQ